MTAAEAQSQTAKTAYVRTIEEKSCGAAKEGMTAWTTELALRAAIRLYAPNQDSADRAFAYLLDK